MDDYSEIEMLRHEVDKLRKLVKELEEEVQHLRASNFVTQSQLLESEERTESELLNLLNQRLDVSENVQLEMMNAIEHCLDTLNTQLNADCSKFFLNRETVQWEQRVSDRIRKRGH